jgi:hypothetical protein
MDGWVIPRAESEESLFFRIIAVAESMTPHNAGNTYNERRRVMNLKKLAGVKLDPHIVDVFLTKVLEQ